MTENDELACRVSDLTAQCCVELFAAYGVALSASSAQLIASDDVLLCGVIGFVGPELRGTCLLVANHSPIAQSSPQKEHTRDWVGELTNQLVGRLKRKCLGFGIELALTTPVVLSGIHLRPMPRRDLRPRVFASESGAIMIWVEVEAEPGFAIGQDVTETTDAEGDVLML